LLVIIHNHISDARTQELQKNGDSTFSETLVTICHSARPISCFPAVNQRSRWFTSSETVPHKKPPRYSLVPLFSCQIMGI